MVLKSLAVLACLGVMPRALGLEVGARAPALEGVTYLRGSAPDFAAAWTLVEFWATWCGPCRSSIPHLAALGVRHGPGLAIVGLSDEPEATVRAFVSRQGDAMPYTVGVVGKATRDAYMAGQTGIPRAFLVNPEGVVAWIGHPQAVDEVVARALAGGIDVARERELQPLLSRFQGALRSRNAEMIAVAADAVLGAVPDHAEAFRVRLALARQAGDTAGARALYERLLADPADVDAAVRAAEGMLADPDLRFRFPDLAVAFLGRIGDAEGRSASALALAARLAYVLGRLDRALALQEEAVRQDASGAAALEYYRQVKALATQSGSRTAWD